MTACEKCWTAASFAARVQGGTTVEHYQRLLAENEAEHTETVEAVEPVSGRNQ